LRHPDAACAPPLFQMPPPLKGDVMSDFLCLRCASPAIVVPPTIEDGSKIRCGRCGAQLGTWGELKERARRAALPQKGYVSCDPLPP
jgi:hypothetical protein